MDRCRLGWLLDNSRKDERFDSRNCPDGIFLNLQRSRNDGTSLFFKTLRNDDFSFCPSGGCWNGIFLSGTSLNGYFFKKFFYGSLLTAFFSDLQMAQRFQFSFGTHIEGPKSCVLKLPVALPKSAVTWPKLAVTGQKLLVTNYCHTSQISGPTSPQLPYPSRWRWPSQPNTDEQEKLASTGPGRSDLMAC